MVITDAITRITLNSWKGLLKIKRSSLKQSRVFLIGSRLTDNLVGNIVFE